MEKTDESQTISCRTAAVAPELVHQPPSVPRLTSYRRYHANASAIPQKITLPTAHYDFVSLSAALHQAYARTSLRCSRFSIFFPIYLSNRSHATRFVDACARLTCCELTPSPFAAAVIFWGIAERDRPDGSTATPTAVDGRAPAPRQRCGRKRVNQ